MAGKSQMFDSAKTFLLFEILNNTPFGIHVGLDRIFINIVEQIKIKIVYTTFFELFFKNSFWFVIDADLMSRIFCGQILKFYCNQRLVPDVKRDKNNRRIFDERDVAWIQSLDCQPADILEYKREYKVINTDEEIEGES